MTFDCLHRAADAVFLGDLRTQQGGTFRNSRLDLQPADCRDDRIRPQVVDAAEIDADAKLIDPACPEHLVHDEPGHQRWRAGQDRRGGRAGAAMMRDRR